jgi:EpsI family protein
MADTNQAGQFLARRAVGLLSAVLLLQAGGFYALSRRENVPAARPLSELPKQFQGWQLAREEAIDPSIQEVLRADDTISRIYFDSVTGRAASLFVAFFKTQRTGQAPHSPKNCLPGTGWVPSESGVVSIQIPGRGEPIRVNRYLVSKGTQSALVLYWYQSRERVIASEYAAKFYLVADAIRHNRTDTALVRVTVPLTGPAGEAARTAEEFVKAFFASLRQFLPA